MRFGLTVCVYIRVCLFFLFLSSSYWLYETKFTAYKPYIHYLHIVYALFTQLKILKIGLTVLFIYLKIILLQFKNYFTHLKIILLQFSVFSFSNNKFNPNRPLVPVWIALNLAFTFCVYVFRPFFFFLHVNSNITWIYYTEDKKHCLCTVHESHDTIHTFKNYFALCVLNYLFSKSFIF